MDNFTAPEGEIFDSFVMDVVKPYIEKNFPVKNGRENTAFCGSSSGGLQSFFTALSHPDAFGAAGVFSPAFLLYSPDDMRRWILVEALQTSCRICTFTRERATSWSSAFSKAPKRPTTS